MHRFHVALAMLAACKPEPSTSTRAPDAASETTVTWSEVRASLDGLICIQSYPDEHGGSYEVALHGMRDECKLPPPATALERATTRAFEQANEVIRAYPEESRAAGEAMATSTDPRARLDAVRAAVFSERVIAVLQRRLGPALAAEGLRCTDCPTPPEPTPRTVGWAELAPYLAAYIWPDPVITPRGEDGKPSGDPVYSMHMCVGINGIQRMANVDDELRFAALLAAFDTEAMFERAPEIYAAVREEPGYIALTTDEARTEHLRAQVGPRVAADPVVRAGICASLPRFSADTPIRLTDCPANDR
jgi:hypothetical protein